MVQVHTVFEGRSWRNKVDGLQQGRAQQSRACAVADGRSIARELHARHYVHDVDGTVLEQIDFTDSSAWLWPGSPQYTA